MTVELIKLSRMGRNDYPHLSSYVNDYIPKDTPLSHVYDTLSKLILPLPDLIRMGYPVPHTDYGMGIISCDRCYKKLHFDDLGYVATHGRCLYHIGEFVGAAKGGKEIYDCCNQSTPCCEANGHLAPTEDKRGPKYYDYYRCKVGHHSRQPRIFALDTERVS